MSDRPVRRARGWAAPALTVVAVFSLLGGCSHGGHAKTATVKTTRHRSAASTPSTTATPPSSAVTVPVTGPPSTETSTTSTTSATTAPAPTAPPATAAVQAGTPGEPAATVTVAQAVVPSVAIFDQPDGQSTTTLANPISSGAPLVFLVADQRPGWLDVELAVRPNGSTGWVRAADVTTTQHHYRIDVELSQHRMTVMQGSSLVLQAPIAVGTSDTPTPAHTFYSKELLKPTDGEGNYIPDGDYGPYAYGLSGFSEVLTDFNGGNGELGIHGTNHPELIGTDVSHGCIRMRNEDITTLAGILPLGVPVRIFP